MGCPTTRTVKIGVVSKGIQRYSCADFFGMFVRGCSHLSLPSVIAIDGPASSGKSTISYLLAERFGYLFIDTGVFYRTMTLVALHSGVAMNDVHNLATLAHQTDINIVPEPNDESRQYSVWVDSQDVTDALRSEAVEANVSVISAIREVRAALVEKQRRIAAQGHIIMAGRDIGTVVLPNAEMKFYIDASIEERARRRYQQKLEKGEKVDLSLIEAGLRQRDADDTHREVSPLRQAEDAIYILTDNKTIDQVIEEIADHIEHWQSR